MPHRGERHERAGVLHPAEAARRIDVGRADPPPGIAGVVDYLWWVTWASPAPYVQAVVPRPVVHLYAEAGDHGPELRVTGVQTRRFDRVLEGSGRTVAAAFRPGGFRPLLGSAVGALRDRDVPVTELLDAAVLEAAGPGPAAVLLDPATPPEEAASTLGDWLTLLAPADDPRVDEVAALVERAEQDRTITRAEQLADLAGVALRTLQRRFDEHVGVGPKWVVRCYRLLDVAEAAHSGAAVDWAALAADLGYADQSHLVRAFTALVGHPPATYARTAHTARG